MTVKPLTKEQKLEIVSKAMDAGAKIDIHFHSVDAGGTASVEDATAILQESLNPHFEFDTSISFMSEDYKLEGTVYFPGKTPTEWQDAGDMEEANA